MKRNRNPAKWIAHKARRLQRYGSYGKDLSFMRTVATPYDLETYLSALRADDLVTAYAILDQYKGKQSGSLK